MTPKEDSVARKMPAANEEEEVWGSFQQGAATENTGRGAIPLVRRE